MVKYSTAVGRLRSVAEEANSHWLRLGDTDIGWPLNELWVAGELLDGPAELDTVAMILMLDEPADDLPWLALHPSGEWIADQLRLTKLPVIWSLRPDVYPAWNARHQRVLRFWSAKAGPDNDVLDRLEQRAVGPRRVVEPSAAELTEQLEVELDACRRHLHQVLDQYWEESWRRQHKGFGVHPEDYLWRAAEAVHEIEVTLGGARPAATPMRDHDARA